MNMYLVSFCSSFSIESEPRRAVVAANNKQQAVDILIENGVISSSDLDIKILCKTMIYLLSFLVIDVREIDINGMARIIMTNREEYNQEGAIDLPDMESLFVCKIKSEEEPCKNNNHLISQHERKEIARKRRLRRMTLGI